MNTLFADLPAGELQAVASAALGRVLGVGDGRYATLVSDPDSLSLIAARLAAIDVTHWVES